jgi:phosphotransferase system HPr-like phosphotransfer protein
MGSTKLVSPEAFNRLIRRRSGELLELAAFIAGSGPGPQCFTRPLLGDVLSEATQLEELLDAYGVRQNRRWYPLRQAAAALKLFSNASYILQHILHFLPTYRLPPLEKDFMVAATQALEFTCRILVGSARNLLQIARRLRIPLPEGIPSAERFADDLPDGRLPPDRESHQAATPEETVVYLATAFLNLAEETRFLHAARELQGVDLAGLLPDPICEERLRSLEQKFHNLQSLYDTHLSDSNTESLDEGLPALRGHISVIYHLLETATAFAHYCERHILGFATAKRPGEIVDSRQLLEVLVRFSLAFSSRYILAARSLCHQMLGRYAVQGRIRVPVPRYRGFHVRPSTLVARIVSHYGSQVVMELEGDRYDAGITLDLFRANEKINASKKRRLAEEALQVLADAGASAAWAPARVGPGSAGAGDSPAQGYISVRGVIQALFASNRLVLYQREVSLGDIQPRADEGLEEFVTRALLELFTVGKIDVTVRLDADFAGDRRVLEDIRLLAENGYGEDDFGNNLPLPAKLEYLRK